MKAGAAALALAASLTAAAAQTPSRRDPPAPAPPPPQRPAPQQLPPAPYEPQLLRLAEVMGSLSLLRELCGAKDGATWRKRMEDLLAAEADASGRKERLAGAFNRGFRDYEASYRVCTPAARAAIEDAIAEGASLASGVTSRYAE